MSSANTTRSRAGIAAGGTSPGSTVGQLMEPCKIVGGGWRETEGHRSSGAIGICRLGGLETLGNGNPVLGIFLNFDPSVMACVEFGDDGEWRDPLINRNQRLKVHRCKRDRSSREKRME